MTLPRFSDHAHRRVVIAVTLLLGACASTTLTSSWKNPEYSGPPLTKIAVFVLAKDENIRRFAEDQMVQKMPKGAVGVAGYRMFDKPEEDKEKVRARLVKEGFDGALVSRLVAMDKAQTYVPPQTYVAPVGPYGGVRPYYGSFYGYYGSAYSTAYTTPGYTVETTTVVVETMLYKLSDDKPVWSGTTQTLNPQSKPEMVQAITDLVETELNKKGVVGAGK